jgi:uncharacterized protein
MVRIGLISDTHGLLRPDVEAFLKGCGCILHAGDICDSVILEKLEKIAPVIAVRGNNDKGSWADVLPEMELLKIEDIYIYVIHDLYQIDIDPEAAGIRVVISGHSHKPLIEEKNGVLYINPGSPGPRRFTLPISVAELIVTGSDVNARIVEFD